MNFMAPQSDKHRLCVRMFVYDVKVWFLDNHFWLLKQSRKDWTKMGKENER